MLVRLTPEQIGTYWNLFKKPILETEHKFLQGNWGLANNIFTHCLAGTAQAWVLYREEKEKVVGFFITMLVKEPVSGIDNLLLYMAYVFIMPSEEEIKICVDTLRNFAKGSGCKNIVYYIRTELAKKLTSSAFGERAKTIPYCEVEV